MRNIAEMADEVVIILVMYHCFCFTDFVPKPKTRHLVGYSVIFCILLHLLIFYLITFFFFMRRTIRQCGVNRAKSRAKKSIREGKFKTSEVGKALKKRRELWQCKLEIDDEEQESDEVELSSSSAE